VTEKLQIETLLPKMARQLVGWNPQNHPGLCLHLGGKELRLLQFDLALPFSSFNLLGQPNPRLMEFLNKQSIEPTVHFGLGFDKSVFHSHLPYMSVVKIHIDDLHDIHTFLGDLLGSSATMIADLRNRGQKSQKLVATILGIPVPIRATPVPEPAPEPSGNILEPEPEATVEEMVEAIAAEITPEPVSVPPDDAPTEPPAVLEGDQAEA